MKKLTKKQIAKAENIINGLSVGVKVSLESTVQCEAKEFVAEEDTSRSFHAGSRWGILTTLSALNKVTVKEMFLLDSYYNEKKWALCDEIRKNGAV